MKKAGGMSPRFRALVRTLKIVAFGVVFSCSIVPGGQAGEAGKGADVVFRTADGGTVHARMLGTGSHGVVLAHGAVFNKESWESFVTKLADNGFTALAIDFRGYGESKAGTKPDALEEDLLAAVRYLHGRGFDRVSLLGASMGGGAAARASIQSKPGEIEKLVLLSPASVASPEQLKGNLLFIASADESLAKKIEAQFERAPEPKKLVLLEGHAHAQHIFKTDQSEALENAIMRFLLE